MYINDWRPDLRCTFLYQLGNPAGWIMTTYGSTLFCLILYCNTAIVRTIRRHRYQINVQENNKPIVKGNQTQRARILGLMLLFMVLCYVPFMLSLLIGRIAGRETTWYQITASISRNFNLVNNCVNPVLFAWKDKKIKAALRKFCS